MAFNTRGQNSPPSYLDGIPVKISEKYKPPKKINVALSYSQILTLNKLIQDPYPNYDFSLEESIKTRVSEWRKVRSTLAEERKQRLQILSQERETKKWNQQQQSETHSGNDANEIVEHLLAMSELLDLGFSEENVVSALLKCDNDRDKALDILIT